MRSSAFLFLVALGFVGCGKSLVQDRVQSTPGVPAPRKPARKVITPTTTAQMDILRLEEDTTTASGWKASGKTMPRLAADVQCTDTGRELGIIVKDRNLTLVAILAGYAKPRFVTNWSSNDKGTITFSDEAAPGEKEEVGPAEGTVCSVIAQSDLVRTEGTLKCRGLEGVSSKTNKKVSYNLIMRFNCAPSRR